MSQSGGQKDTIKLPKLCLYQITNQLSARSDSLNQLRLATQEDDELVLLKHSITQGWPSTIREIPHGLQPYWTFREELTVEDGLVLKGTRIVIPNKKCKAVLKFIHEGHLRLNKCKLHAKNTVYWPGLNDLYMHGQSLQHTYSILREHSTYLLWIILAGFPLCTSYHP